MKTLGISCLITFDMDGTTPIPMVSEIRFIQSKGDTFVLKRQAIVEFKRIAKETIDRLPSDAEIVFQDKELRQQNDTSNTTTN